MAAIQPEYKDQQPAAGLTLNLSSNNPFRNRAVSPALHSPVSPFDDPVPPPRPISRNPFLDPALANRSSTQNIRAASEAMSTQDKTSSSPTADDLFGSLSIEDKQSPALIPIALDGARPPPNRRGPPPGRENMPPPGRRGPPPNHRPTRSQEEALRARRRQANDEGAAGGPSDGPRSPQKRERRRRNSESSVVDDRDKPLTEEEKKARDARRRERERRHQENKAKKPVNRKLDIIDQLDATSIYGTGMFHHDGPFDALNPHRNKGNSRRAPMQAFPKDSLNNVIGGSGPLNARPDHAALMGRHDDEAFKEWSTGAAKDREARKAEIPPVFDPLSRGSILHGDESLGLGTSTFLEGTPAARTAIQKREEERAAETFNEGLQRKKSLAQRIRGINRGPRDFQSSGRMTNPEGVYTSRRTPSDGGQPYERNPFFSDVDSNGNKRPAEETISVRRPDSNGDKVSPTNPRAGYGLERRATTDATAALEDGYSKPSGILGRMKSLKGGRRTRPAPPNGENIAIAAPGTAV